MDQALNCTHPHRPVSLAGRLRKYWAIRRQRHQLTELTERQLYDIGLTREAAEEEAARPAWDVPAAWRR